MAAAIAFYAILSMIPFMLLSFSVIGYVLNHMGQTATSQQELYTQLQSTIQTVVPFLTDEISSSNDCAASL